MNQKGFTMVELLATIVILGLLASMAYSAYMYYESWSKQRAYKIMAFSARQSTENYIMDHPGDVLETKTESLPGGLNYYIPKDDYNLGTIKFEELVKLGYFTDPIDPNSKDITCTGGVRVGSIPGEIETAVDQYVYEVDVCCPAYQQRFVYSYVKKTVGGDNVYEEYEFTDTNTKVCTP